MLIDTTQLTQRMHSALIAAAPLIERDSMANHRGFLTSTQLPNNTPRVEITMPD
jgi:hypothetical protein